MQKQSLLKFSPPNSKIAFPSFSIPAGWTCPGAGNCLTKRMPDGKLVDLQTPDDNGLTYRCYATSLEVVYPSLAKMLDHNEDLLRKTESENDLVALIIDSLMSDKSTKGLFHGGGALRVHIHGDFFKYLYLKAWFAVAKLLPDIRFYSYTKSLQFFKRYKEENGTFPKNYSLTWSKGSRFDSLGPALGIKSVTLVKDEEEAKALGLEIDHDDLKALKGKVDFALEPHGAQPAGHPLGKVIAQKRKAGKFAGYNKK
jgi:hypothetical protein